MNQSGVVVCAGYYFTPFGDADSRELCTATSFFVLFFVANYYTNYDECSQVEMFSSYALYS